MKFSTASLVLLVLIVISASLVIGAPWIIKQKLEQQASLLLGEKLSIGTLHLNPFVGSVELLKVKTESGAISFQRLFVNVAMLDLFDRHVGIQSLQLSALDLSIDRTGETIKVAGYTIPSEEAGDKAATEEPLALTFGISEALISDSELRVIDQGVQHLLRVNAFRLSGYDQRSPGEAPIDIDLHLPQGEINLDGRFIADAGEFSFNGQVSLVDIDLAITSAYQPWLSAGKLSLDQSGLIAIAPKNVTIELVGGVQVSGLQGNGLSIDDVSWQGTTKLGLADHTSFTLQGTLAIGQINSPELGKLANLNYEGKINGEVAAQGESHYRLDGKLAAEQLLSEEYGGFDQADWQGTTAVSVTAARAMGSTTEPLQLGLVNEGKLQVARLQYPKIAQISGLNWQGKFEFKQSEGQSITAEGDADITSLVNPNFGSVNSILVKRLGLTFPGNLQLGELNVSGARLKLKRSKDGKIAGVPETNQQTVKVTPDSKPFALSIDKTRIVSTQIEFVDYSVSPAVDMSLENFSLHAENFSLDHEFSFDLEADHQIHTGLDATVKSSGKLRLSPLTGEVDSKIKNFELHELSSYMGGGIQAGRLNLTSEAKLANGSVEASNHIRIEGMKVSEQLNEGSTGANGQMSLSMALFLLKDKQGIVELDVPIKTDLSDIKVGTSDIVAKAMFNAAQKTTLTYAQYALLPYGGILLAKDLFDYATQVKFEPIVFEPLESRLSENATGYAKKLAEMLIAKPNMTLSICGIATGQDIEGDVPVDALTQMQKTQLRHLAKQRAINIQEEIVKQGVKGQRLYACQERLVGDKSQPRVEISL